jgi:hydroxypyruvate reductase
VNRRKLLETFEAGLRAVDGRRCTREFLQAERPSGPIHLIAIGKCAGAMALGARDALGVDLRDGVVITRHGYAVPELREEARITVMETSHPVPDETSVAAGHRLLAHVRDLPPGCRVLALISGGASSLVEVLPDGVGVADLERVNHWLLGSGLDILAVNAVRRRMSLIKNGGLSSALWGRRTLALYISDVPGDDPAWIGSGLLAPQASELPEGLPRWLSRLLIQGAPASTPGDGVRHEVIANLDQALDACCSKARTAGIEVTRHRSRLDEAVDEAALRITSSLRKAADGIQVWGGEPTVRLPDQPGRGGRSQHLALRCATAIRGYEDLAILCAATDGADGSGEDAGALVDGSSVQRGRDAGMDPEVCLERADSGSFLEAAGDLIFTGPTSTNVNDIVIGVRGYTR